MSGLNELNSADAVVDIRILQQLQTAVFNAATDSAGQTQLPDLSFSSADDLSLMHQLEPFSDARIGSLATAHDIT